MGLEKRDLKHPKDRKCKHCGHACTDAFGDGGPVLCCNNCSCYELYHMEDCAIELCGEIDIYEFSSYENYLKALLEEG